MLMPRIWDLDLSRVPVATAGLAQLLKAVARQVGALVVVMGLHSKVATIAIARGKHRLARVPLTVVVAEAMRQTLVPPADPYHTCQQVEAAIRRAKIHAVTIAGEGMKGATKTARDHTAAMIALMIPASVDVGDN
jgi:hypothetical protein